MYLYRAVDSDGNTIDFYLSKVRNNQTGIEAMHMIKKDRFFNERSLSKIKKNSFTNCLD